jgi:hypothetical protein
MIEVKSVQPFLINIDGNNKIIYYNAETKGLFGYTFTKEQESEILAQIDFKNTGASFFIDNSILEDAMAMKLEVEDSLQKIKEIYVN